jgi:hypothetical protein
MKFGDVVVWHHSVWWALDAKNDEDQTWYDGIEDDNMGMGIYLFPYRHMHVVLIAPYGEYNVRYFAPEELEKIGDMCDDQT